MLNVDNLTWTMSLFLNKNDLKARSELSLFQILIINMQMKCPMKMVFYFLSPKARVKAKQGYKNLDTSKLCIVKVAFYNDLKVYYFLFFANGNKIKEGNS